LSGTPNAVTATIQYDSAFSQPLTVTDPLGNTTSIAYDTYGNAVSVTDPLGHQTTMGYNAMGLPTSITDALQHTTQLTYDFADLIGITDPMLNTSSVFRDGAGRVVSETDPLGNTVKYQYSPLNQVTQITDPLQGVTTFTYDPNGNPLTVQDARQQGTNHKTIYTYDNFDHLQTRTDPLLRQEGYVFDQLDNLSSFTDRRGKVMTYQYDGINRRVFSGFGTQPGPTYESTINYSYDGGDRLTKVVDSTSGTITPVFDGLDRLQSETTPQGSVSYQYDNDSRLTSATVSGQPSVCYSYDTATRLTGIGQGTCPTNTNSVSVTYDTADRRSTLTLPNGIVLSYGFDNDSRINGLSYQLGATQIGTLTYQYDAVGRRTQVGGSLGASGFPQPVASAIYDVANELTNWNGGTIIYDQNGNIQNDGAAIYTWNARNQLISRGGTGFQYDAFGRRTLNAAGNNLLYEGLNVGQELSGTTPIANRILGGIDEFFSRTDSTGSYSPITDALGSVLALANSSGNITTQYQYDPFGNTTSYGSGSNLFEYTGRENEANGLYFYRSRYYSPAFGRFVSEDAIGFSGGTNLHRYAEDSPVSGLDPYGTNTTVIIVRDPDPTGTYGSHSGLYIDNNGNPEIYDPGGSYATSHGCGSSDACFPNDDAGTSLPDYINFQLANGSTVDTYTFPTTTGQEAQIANNIDNHGGGMPLFCTLTVCNVVGNVGPFNKLPHYFWPGNLGRDLAGRGACVRHYGTSPKRNLPFISGPIIFSPLGGW
jgi:RHS repeat-associated protein